MSVSNFRNYINVYEFECTLPGSKEVVKFKPITTGQLKKLLIYEKEVSPLIQEKALDELISSSVISDDFDIKKLFLEDRFFLLIEIRKKTKGEVFEFNYKCSECGTVSIIKIDLNTLKITRMPEKYVTKVKLNDDISLELAHIKRIDQIKNEKHINTRESINQQIVNMQILTYASSITKITTPDGEENPSIIDKKYLLENIPTPLFDKVKHWHESNTFGIDFTFKSQCINCKDNIDMDIPLENFFF